MTSLYQQAMIPIEDISDVFDDLTPIPVTDGPDRVCVIEYPTAFAIAYNYMRAVWATKELSERALKLSATCLNLNPANYTVWHYRRLCLKSLGYSSNKERVKNDLDLASILGGSNPKNYQVWYHRRAMLETYGLEDFAMSELEYIAEVLDQDSKNYHAWSYRQWIIQEVDKDSMWEDEKQYVSTLIQEDPRNNSAWNQRWFSIHRGTKIQLLPPDVARAEADYAITVATLDPYNESPWVYFVGILREQCRAGAGDDTNRVGMLKEYEGKVYAVRNVLSNVQREPDTCSNLTSARIDVLELIGDRTSLEEAMALSTGLATEYDVIRRKYWSLRADQLQARLGKLVV